MRATHLGRSRRLQLLLIAAALTAGCGNADWGAGGTIGAPTPNAAATVTTTDSIATVDSGSPSTTTHVRQATDFDGVVSDGEGADATYMVMANPIARALIADHGAELSEWQPGELEGEQRGAYAILELEAPTTMEPRIIWPDAQLLAELAGDGGDTGYVDLSADDYVLREKVLTTQVVSRYAVTVDLATMRIIGLAPMPDPPALVPPGPTGGVDPPPGG